MAAKLMVAVVGPGRAWAEALEPHLDAPIALLSSPEELLQLPGHYRIGVAVLHGALDWTAALPVLRRREDLKTTFWLSLAAPAAFSELLRVGADAVLPETLTPAAVAHNVDALLERGQAAQHYAAEVAELQAEVHAAEHEERVRDQLVHMLVHDLKNPITAILGLIEVVVDDPRLPRDAGELLEVARDETQHLLHLSLNMLDVRKIQAGKMHLRREQLLRGDLAALVDQASTDVGSGLAERQVTVELADMPPLPADPTLLRRVLANLLSNAQKHTVRGGRVRVSSEVRDGELWLSVADNGEGIPEEDIPRLFAAFEQSRLTLHGRFDTGMGLAFCKLAAEEHGGRIWVESVRGLGSTFTLALPLGDGNDDVELLL